MKKVSINSYDYRSTKYRFIKGSLYQHCVYAEQIILCTMNSNTLSGVIISDSHACNIGTVDNFCSDCYVKFLGTVTLED